ncbi:hypothetical protein ACWEGQ_01620 [Streptomyces seoulensis]
MALFDRTLHLGINAVGFGERSAVFVNEGDVVVTLRPVDAAEYGRAALTNPSVYAGPRRLSGEIRRFNAQAH